MTHDNVTPSIPSASAWNEEWALEAQCGPEVSDELFVRGAAQHAAKRICAGCPVRTECLVDALDGKVDRGVWGGTTERERRALLRRRPEVSSWRRLVQDNRAGHLIAQERSTPPALRAKNQVAPAPARRVDALRTVDPVDSEIDAFFTTWPPSQVA